MDDGKGWPILLMFAGAIIVGFGLHIIFPPLAIVYSGAALFLFGLAGIMKG